jgi:hypothetical protein
MARDLSNLCILLEDCVEALKADRKGCFINKTVAMMMCVNRGIHVFSKLTGVLGLWYTWRMRVQFGDACGKFIHA